MYYIVGLGNKGKEYDGTRHNVGFAALDLFAEKYSFSSWHDKSALNGWVAEGNLGSEEAVLLKPHTFMNDSGSAVKKLVPKGSEERTIVVYDDIDLPFGDIKVSFSRGNGGHNGVRSLIDTLGTPDFVRIRIGIAEKSLFTGSLKRPKGAALAQFVLGTFSRSETKQLPEVLTRASEAIRLCIEEGKEKAMNHVNERA